MMAINGQEDKDRKDILKLGNESDLSFTLGIKNVCCGKAHLKTDDCCAKFNRGKNQSGDKAKQQS